MSKATDALATTRVEYTAGTLETINGNPLEQFTQWYDEATAYVHEPNAMVVSTHDEWGPDSRIVLLKSIRADGFVFFTNYNSTKGHQLTADPRAALVFPWHEMQRQVRVRGVVSKVSPQESDEYFASRPRGSQLGAVASVQSAPVASRQALEDAYAVAQTGAAQRKILRPAHWGGYVLKPTVIEFWQGRASRLHDRFQFVSQHRDNGVPEPAQLSDPAAWVVQRLNP